MYKLIRGIVSGVIGGVSWFLGMLLFFRPAQSILGDPELQSEKFLFVVREMEPLTRSIGNTQTLITGLLLIGVVYGITFSFLRCSFKGSSILKGIKFGAVGWALMVPWFEFYLPWNVMHEPLSLVLLEAFLWFLVLQLVGITISITQSILLRESIIKKNV